MKTLLLALIRAYRLLFSPWLGNACRLAPSCSVYAQQAVVRHGAAVGTYLALGRLCRCQPWCHGGADPVPAEAPRLFGRLFSLSTSEKSS